MRSQAIFWKMRGSPAHDGPGQQNPAARAASWTAAAHRREAAAPGCPRCWSGGTCPAWDCLRRCSCRHAAARLLLTRGMTCFPKLTMHRTLNMVTRTVTECISSTFSALNCSYLRGMSSEQAAYYDTCRHTISRTATMPLRCLVQLRAAGRHNISSLCPHAGMV